MKKLIQLILIAWFSVSMMCVSHELWHVFQFHEVGVSEICFMGYKADTSTDFIAFGWVIPNALTHYTEWDAYVIGIGITLASFLIFVEVLIRR